MADDSLEFLVRTTFDSSGTNAAQKAYADLKGNVAPAAQEGEGAFKSLNKTIEETVGSHRKLVSAVKTLSPEFAALGHEIFLGLTNPIIASVVAAGVAVEIYHKLQERVEALGEALEHINEVGDAIEHAAQFGEAWKQSFEEANIAAIIFHDTLERLEQKQESLAEKTDDAVEAAKRQAQANQKVADAEKERDLARLEALEKSGQITKEEAARRKQQVEDDADARKTAAANAADQAEIAKRKEERDKAAGDQTDKDLDVNHATGANRKAQDQVGVLSDMLQAAKDAKTKADKDAADSKLPKEVRKGAELDSRTAGGKIDDFERQLATAKEEAAKTQAALAEAQKKATENATLKNELDRKVGNLEGAANTHASARAREDAAHRAQREYKSEGEEAGSKLGKMVSSAGDAEYAHEHGQKTTATQEASMKQLTKIAQANGMNAEMILRGLAALHNNQEGTTKQIAKVVKDIERLQAQGRGVHNP